MPAKPILTPTPEAAPRHTPGLIEALERLLVTYHGAIAPNGNPCRCAEHVAARAALARARGGQQ